MIPSFEVDLQAHTLFRCNAMDVLQLDDSSEHVKISHLNVAAPLSDGTDRSLERRLAEAKEGSFTSILINNLNLVRSCGVYAG